MIRVDENSETGRLIAAESLAASRKERLSTITHDWIEAIGEEAGAVGDELRQQRRAPGEQRDHDRQQDAPGEQRAPPRPVKVPERSGDDHQHDDRDEESEVVDVVRQRCRDPRAPDAPDERLEVAEERQVEEIGRRAGRQRAEPGEDEGAQD